MNAKNREGMIGGANVHNWVNTLMRMHASQAVKHSRLMAGNAPSCGRAYQ